MNKYDLSIIIPTYNTRECLKRTLNILESQYLKKFEIIIIDDNSNDNTEDLIIEFQKFDTDIKYIKNNSTKGPGLSRNIGINNANGEFITFLDSDDWPDLNTYDAVTKVMKNNPNYDFSIWGVKKEYENSVLSQVRNNYDKTNVLNKDVAISLLCNTNSLDISISSYLGNKMFRSDFLRKNNLEFIGTLFEDVSFSFEAIIYSREILLLPNTYTHYYQRSNSIVHSFTEKHINDMFSVLYYLKKIVDKKFPDFKKDFASLVEKCSKTLFNIMFDNVETPTEIRHFLCIYIEKLLEFTDVQEIFDYIDINRIKNILLNH